MQFNKTWTPAALDADGLAPAGTAGTAGVAFVLSNADTPGDNLGHILTIAPSGAVTGNYVISGLDADLLPQTETLATNAGSTVSSAKYWRDDIVILAPSGIGAETVTIGWTAVAVTQSIGLEKFSIATAAVSCDVTGTCNFTIQQTNEDFFNAPQQNGVWSTVIAAGAIDVSGSTTQSMRCARGLINSVTASATLRIAVAQAIAP